MRNFIIFALNFLISLIFISAHADLTNQTVFTKDSSYQVCFTPDQDCTQEIINLINSARSQIRVQVYSFTSKPIARALVQAHKRGVDVQVIYDRSDADSQNNKYQSFSYQPYLTKNHIPGFIDPAVGIAHNKVMIIDGQTIETGSFNYTKAAQDNNAENVLIINSKALAQDYLSNWNKRQKISSVLN